MKWLKIIAMLPVAALVFPAVRYWEKWHFGPSQRILQVTRNAKKWLIKWRNDLEKD